jgi:imidazolonepropionase-like amidohydrolase
VHQTSLASLELAVDAGVDIVDHVELSVSDEVIQAIARKQITWVPTLQVIQHFMSRDCSKTVRDFVAAGGRVAMGTDSGYYTFLSIGMPMYEINYLSQAGLNPMQVIVAATHNSAYACGINREVGTLEPGKTADVLVLSANPLDDLKALAQPKMVIHLGRVLEKTK